MTDYQTLRLARHSGVATVTIQRPAVHNAFNAQVVREISATFLELRDDRSVRVIVLAGAGRSFSAGADLHWMRKMLDYTPDENLEDARALAAMFRTIDRSPKPVIARVQGAALGGGAGLVAVADICVAATDARFAFSEVRLGLIPAVISPFVVSRIGSTHARRYFLTGERFDARRAVEIGLVSQAVPPETLDDEVRRLAQEVRCAGPEAVAAAKELIFAIEDAADSATLTEETARRIAERRASPEGQAGMQAFLDKRSPPWMEG